MIIYQVGVVGHTPEYVQDIEQLDYKVKRTMSTLQHQYGDDLLITLSADPGIAELAADACISLGIKFHLILPCPPEDMEFLLLEEQYEKLQMHFQHCSGASIISPTWTPDIKNNLSEYKNIVHNARFIVCFWNGMKQGAVFETIKYALETNTLVINALNDMKMVTNEDLKRV